MSVRGITPDAVLDAIRHGKNTYADLADHFGVLPGSKTLHDVVDELIAAEKVVELTDRTLIPNDLIGSRQLDDAEPGDD